MVLLIKSRYQKSLYFHRALAVLLRAKLVGALARTAGWRYRIGRGLETGAALAVIAFGTILFLQR